MQTTYHQGNTPPASQRAQTARLSRYRDALRRIPAPGNGCHNAQLGVANLGAIAGIAPDVLTDDILSHIPQGARRVSRREVADTVAKAYRDRVEGHQRPYTPAPQQQATCKAKTDTSRFWNKATTLYGDKDAVCELRKRSPIRLDVDPKDGAAHILNALYSPDEYVYIGGAMEHGIPGHNLRTAADWIKHAQDGGALGPHVIVNPLTGTKAQKKDGGWSYRCDAAIAAHRYCLIEFDEIPKERQALFWLHAKLPVAAIIDSGGKSLHGWVRVDCTDAGEWNTAVRPLFDGVLADFGADKACKNPARMSRTPGVERGENWQRLLYLAPGGKAVAA